jgi:hypothetical protein
MQELRQSTRRRPVRCWLDNERLSRGPRNGRQLIAALFYDVMAFKAAELSPHAPDNLILSERTTEKYSSSAAVCNSSITKLPSEPDDRKTLHSPN